MPADAVADPIPNAEPSAPAMDAGDDSLDNSLRDAFTKSGAEPDQSALADDRKPDAHPDGEKPPPDDGKKPDEGADKPPVVDPKLAKAKPAAPKSSADDPEKVKPPAKLSKEGLEGWNALKETAKKNHALVQEREKEIQILKNVIAEKSEGSKKEMEKLQGELKELRGYRASFDHQFDPDFQKQYGAPMTKLESEMTKMLTGMGVKDEAIKLMRFADENQMSRVAASIEENVNSITADRFRSRVKDYIELSDKKREFLDEFKVKHEEFKAQKAKEIQQRSVEEGSVQFKHINELAAAKNDAGEHRIPFLLTFEPNPDATQDQIKAIEAHNAKAVEYRARLDELVREIDPKKKAEAAVAAVAATFLNEKLAEAQKQVKSLSEQLAKYNKVSTEKGARESGPKTTADVMELNGTEAIERAFPNMR